MRALDYLAAGFVGGEVFVAGAAGGVHVSATMVMLMLVAYAFESPAAQPGDTKPEQSSDTEVSRARR